MNDKFDELAKNLAESVTRRSALKKFSLGLAGIALASLGLASGAQGAQQLGCLSYGSACRKDQDCCSGFCARSKARNGGVIRVCT